VVWPAKPIRLIVPFPPGGTTDVVTRLVAAELTKTLGQSVVVDNKPGAGTVLGVDLAAKALPDGHTLVTVANSFCVNQTLVKNLPYDGLHDLRPVGLMGHSLGGATAVAETRTDCCSDDRVAASVLVAPAVGIVSAMFGEEPSTSGPPTLLVNGTLDSAIPHDGSLAWWRTLDAPAAFLSVPGAHHSDLVENVGDPAPFLEPTEIASAGLFDEYVSGARGSLGAAAARLDGLGYELLAR